MTTEFELAIKQICEEKGISEDEVISSIEAALSAAFRKDYGEKGQNIEAKFDLASGSAKIFEVVEVVEDEEVEKPQREIGVKEAQEKDKNLKLGDKIKTDVTPDEITFGRIAAQTAKQVITQRLREAERNVIMDTFKKQEGTVVSAIVQRVEKNTVFVDMGQATGVLLPSEQIKDEHYAIGQRFKVYVMSVSTSQKGPEILVSRAHEDIVRKLFDIEVPEVGDGEVEIKALAREAGSRSKVAVYTTHEEIDPVGACVGQRGSRVQTIISELNGEKIDIVEWDENPVKFITNALSPAKVISVRIDEASRHAIVEVMEDQLSLAIGKSGQNVRLAVKLTGWTIDVEKANLGGDTKEEKETEVKEDKKKVKKEKKSDKKTEKKAKKTDKKVKTEKKSTK
ncbi:transcription termination factor NusA [Patescibacteria group bacterium]|nr:transcription termination factor NusA [Patescibacteria group bacterium]